MTKILVVDDEFYINMLVQHILMPLGFEVLSAQDGLAALTLIEKHPDLNLIISDLSMPELDGFGLLRALQHHSNIPPILMLTAHGDSVDENLAKHLGAKGLIRKPFSRMQLLDSIRDYVPIP